MIGPSGSGKSTFLRLINHLEKLDAGRLWVDGELVGYRQQGDKIYELKDSEVCAKRAQIGMVFQRFNLFPHLSVLENVTIGPTKVRGTAAKDAQERAATAVADAVITVNDALGDRLLDLGVPAAKLTVILNAPALAH